MLKMLIAGGLLIPALALAEPVKVAKPVVCDEIDRVFSFFAKEYNEEPMWIGEVAKNESFMIMANHETKTWTAIQFSTSEPIACVIESGTGFKFKILGKSV